MKNALRAFGLIALVAVIGFSMAACDSGGGGDSTSSALDGVWELSSNGYQINIKGNTGYIKSFGNNTWALTAESKGNVRIGDPDTRNIKSAGNNTWTAETLLYYASGATQWTDCKLTLSADGSSLTFYRPKATSVYVTYTRR